MSNQYVFVIENEIERDFETIIVDADEMGRKIDYYLKKGISFELFELGNRIMVNE